MARIEPFEKYSKQYDEWFIKNQDIYLAEINAIKKLVPSDKFGVEIGVGTGRFALPLGIKVGVDPSRKMAEMSRKRGIQVYEGMAEQLPFNDKIFDFVLMVTTICFVNDLVKSFKEAYRVLKTDGFIIVGFVDKESELGKRYQSKRKKSKFYKDATFYSVKTVIDLLKKTNFEIVAIRQTVFPRRTGRIDSVEDGYGKGSFVIIKAIKKTNLKES
ncbi:MAG: class I SAM-dependent methyltransferase [Petrotogales bacterium]